MCPARSVTIQARAFVGDGLMIRRRRQATPPVPLNGSEPDITMTGGLHLRHEHDGKAIEGDDADETQHLHGALVVARPSPGVPDVPRDISSDSHRIVGPASVGWPRPSVRKRPLIHWRVSRMGTG